MRAAISTGVCVLAVSVGSHAQGLPQEIVPPGDTVATTTDADSARLNMGAVALSPSWSVRLTGVGEFRAQNTPLNAIALTATAPLLFDFAVSAGASWQHVEVAGGTSGDLATGDLGLSYALLRGLGIGARLRLLGGGGQAGLLSVQGGSAALDAGIEWHANPWLAFAITGVDLLGPQLPVVGLDRAGVIGVGFRPTGTDAITVGVDGSLAQSGDAWLRAGARVRVPSLGLLRAEGIWDAHFGTWRASAGIEFVFGNFAAGGGPFIGSAPAGIAAPLGGYVSLGVNGEPARGLPEPGMVVVVSTDGDLGARGIAHLVIRLERMRRDPRVKGILFAPHGDVGGVAHAEELREEFNRLRADGVRVACHLIDASGSTYDACSATDSISMDPSGTLRTAGVRSGLFFLGDSLRDIGVRAEFVRIGAWKSAPEQFTRRGSTPEARAQEEQLMDDIYASLLSEVARSRTVATGRAYTTESARQLIEAGPYTARDALRAGLIDRTETLEEAQRAFARAAHAAVVPSGGYTPYASRRWAPHGTVAVVYVDGDMIDGDSFDIPFLGMHFVGDRTVIQAVDDAAADGSVGAIVLRIESGGGSAMSAETIWRAVERASHRKPVVVSMGSEAASAAYYIAAPGRVIFADPATLTGSIGIFYGKADISPLLTRLDVGLELIRRGPRADMDSIFRSWTADERTLIGRMIGQFYNQFLERVAAGRHMTTEAVNRVGEGRVFAASRAQGLGLVDRLGGLGAAIDEARTLGGLSGEYSVRELPVESTGLLGSLVSLLAEDPRPSPAARLFSREDLRTTLAWLYTVGASGQGHPMAMTEWPIFVP